MDTPTSAPSAADDPRAVVASGRSARRGKNGAANALNNSPKEANNEAPDVTMANTAPPPGNNSNNNSFSLLPAIFVPFHGIGASRARPKDRDEKLRRILEDLDKHHDSVRRNMIYLVSVQKEKLLSEAREALERNEKDGDSDTEAGGRSAGLREDINKLMENLKTPAKKGADLKEYEYQGDFMNSTAGIAAEGAGTGGDAAMGSGKACAAATIRQNLNRSLQELALRAASEMKAYDKHAETTKDYYKRALERNALREGTGVDVAFGGGVGTGGGVAGGKGGGIPGNRNEEVRVGREALARMAMEEGRSSASDKPVGNVVDDARDPRRNSVDMAKNPRRNSIDHTRDMGMDFVDAPKGPRRGSIDAARDRRR